MLTLLVNILLSKIDNKYNKKRKKVHCRYL